MSEYQERTSDHIRAEILRCRVGSKAYGCDGPDSDDDYKGIYVCPKKQLYALDHTELSRRYSADDQSYALHHYAHLCAKSAPNALELLFCLDEDVINITAEGEMLKESRSLFLSKKCAQSFKGYAQSQIKRCSKKPVARGAGRTDLIKKFGYDVKFAMHTIRLLQTAEDLLRRGELIVRRPNGDFLRSILNGEAFKDFSDFITFAEQCIEEVDWLANTSSLPEHPPYDMISDLIIDIHDHFWGRTMG